MADDFDPDKYTICELCFPGAVTIGSYDNTQAHFTEFYLAKSNAEITRHIQGPNGTHEEVEVPASTYFITDANGHELIYWFRSIPIPDPDPNFLHEDEEDHPIHAVALDWLSHADKEFQNWKERPSWGYWLITRFAECGWNDEQYPVFEQWLYHRTGQLIAEVEGLH